MLGGNTGCCCGLVLGFLLALLLMAAAAFGIYCWFVPEARSRSIQQVEVTWEQVKDGGDAMVEKARSASPSVPVEPKF